VDILDSRDVALESTDVAAALALFACDSRRAETETLLLISLLILSDNVLILTSIAEIVVDTTELSLLSTLVAAAEAAAA
jgi:hypothetical protein